MVVSIISLLICAFVTAILIGMLAKAKKIGIPVGRPILYGICAMAVGYFVASLVIIGLNAAISKDSIDVLFESQSSDVLFGAVTGALIAAAMFVILVLPMKKQRSGMEVMIFGIGVSLPLYIYRLAAIVFTNIECIQTGVSYSDAFIVFVSGIIALFTSMLEVLCALILAHFINNNKKVFGLITVAVVEIITYGAGSFSESFGWSQYVYPIVMSTFCLAAFFFVKNVWRRFPETVVERKKDDRSKSIQWPDERWDDEPDESESNDGK